MAKLIERLKDAILGEYVDDEYDEYDEYDDYEERTPERRDYVDYAPRSASQTSSRRSSNAASSNSQVVSIHTNVQMQVVIIKPECYEDAQEICDQVKSKKPVVVNLEKVEYPIAQRIMDFLSGTCYSLEGSIQRVANNIFIIAPENVDISGDFKEELKTKGIILPWVNSGK